MLLDSLIDWIDIYTVSEIFQSCNGGEFCPKMESWCYSVLVGRLYICNVPLDYTFGEFTIFGKRL